jgi:hypothetical protein
LQCPLAFHLPSTFLYLKSKITAPTVQLIVEAPLVEALVVSMRREHACWCEASQVLEQPLVLGTTTGSEAGRDACGASLSPCARRSSALEATRLVSHNTQERPRSVERERATVEHESRTRQSHVEHESLPLRSYSQIPLTDAVPRDRIRQTRARSLAAGDCSRPLERRATGTQQLAERRAAGFRLQLQSFSFTLTLPVASAPL